MKMCLDDNQVAYCAELLADFENVELSDELKSHLGSCLDCAMEVLEVWELIRIDKQGICSRFE